MESIMAKMFNGKVSVIKNTKGEITVQRDADGKFDQSNVQELYDTMKALATKHKTTCRFFVPEQLGDTPVLMADRWGKPYVAVLPARKAPSAGTTTRPSVEKLA
jgi:hypothetical protein